MLKWGFNHVIFRFLVLCSLLFLVDAVSKLDLFYSICIYIYIYIYIYTIYLANNFLSKLGVSGQRPSSVDNGLLVLLSKKLIL